MDVGEIIGAIVGGLTILGVVAGVVWWVIQGSVKKALEPLDTQMSDFGQRVAKLEGKMEMLLAFLTRPEARKESDNG